MEVKIVVPSHRRAGRVLTHKAVEKCILCVPQSQEAQYREHYPDVEVVAHPDDIVGLPPKREWMCSYFGDVIQIDDDIRSMQRRWTPPCTGQAKVSPRDAWQIVQNLGALAKEAGVYLFGFSTVINPMQYQANRPFALTGLVNGSSLGLLAGSKVRFVLPGYEHLVAVDDTVAALLNAYYHRMMIIDLRFSFVPVDTFKGLGGNSQYRTMDTEVEDNKALIELFGSNVVKIRPGATHEHQRAVRIPF